MVDAIGAPTDLDEFDETASPDVDGRRLRRERNRTAVIDALVAMIAEGNLNPSSSEVAERAGLSARSLFRYFDDIDDLTSTAFEVLRDRVRPLAWVPLGPSDPLDRRVEALVRSRIALFEAIGSGGIVSRTKAPFNERVAAELGEGRRHLREQIGALFATELGALGEHGALRLAALDVVTSFDSYVLLRDDQRLDPADIATSIHQAVVALLRQ